MAVLAAFKLPDAVINVVQKNDWESPFDGVYTNSKNLFAFYSGAEHGVEARYLRAGADQFKRIGEVVFRPAGYQLQARGVAKSQGLECWLDDCRMEAFNRAVPRWTKSRLDQALDIREERLRSYLLRLRQEVVRPGMAAQAVVDSLFVILLNDLAEYFIDDPSEGDQSKGGKHTRAVARVVERIMDLAEVTPTVGELAQMAALSERHLLRIFREAKGTSLADFIRQTRLERAKQLLTATDLPLKVVAYRLGFSSHASFTTAFTRDMRVSPCEYRRENRRQGFYLQGRC